MKLKLEILISKIEGELILYDVYYVDITESEVNPDDTVLAELEKISLNDYSNFIIHSTSWRFDEKDSIFITYLVLIPDDVLFKFGNSINLSKVKNRNASESFRPSLENLQLEHVIKHAFQHLAFLITHRKDKVYQSKLNKNQINFLKSLHEDVAGEIE